VLDKLLIAVLSITVVIAREKVSPIAPIRIMIIRKLFVNSGLQ
jgi:hypothetical protein